MAIRVYNSLTRNVQPLCFQRPGKAGIYVCGPTVYDDPHLGHARCAVVFDVIVRYIKAKGHAVQYVRNITDLDDKIIDKARKLNRDFKSLGRIYIRRFHDALRHLQVLAPDAEPKASETIIPMRGFISKLIQSGHAYHSCGNVYFAVESFAEYGKLSRRKVESFSTSDELHAQGGKRHPADFALWKAAKSDEPFWPSPWGPGRPGWHIECSAMSAHILGETYDIHGGGSDLIFPHHENEIAQSESLFGKIPAQYWIHNGLVHMAGEKMSKSLGNTLNLFDLMAIYRPEALRFFLLSKQYRHPIEFSHQAMLEASAGLSRLCRFLEQHAQLAAAAKEIGLQKGSLWTRFCRAMDEDFNFPMALSVIFSGIRGIHRMAHNDSAGGSGQSVLERMGQVSDIDFICRKILGIAPKFSAEGALSHHEAALSA
jgi:cysteinyl-tRNA synthetase